MRSPLALLILLTAPLLAQDAAAPAETPVFRAETKLVTVEVQVRDGHNRPITGLTAKDFKLFQDQEQVAIRNLDEVTFAADATPVEKGASATPNPGPAAQNQTRSARSHVVLVLDQVNTAIEDQIRAKNDLAKELHRLRSNDVYWLFSLQPAGLHLLKGPVTNPEELVPALKQVVATQPVTFRAGEDALRARDPGSQRIANSGATRQADIGQYQSALGLTLHAFERFAKEFGQVRGRKSVLWATGGFPFSLGSGRKETSSFSAAFDLVMDQMAEAQVAVYPIDIRGLQSVGLPTAEYEYTNNNARRPEQHVAVVAGRQSESLLTMETIADATGGRSYLNSNDLGLGLADAVNDGSAYYLLSYRPTPEQLAPGTHRLHVQVDAKHAHVRSRKYVYVAGSPSRPPTSGR